MYRSKMKFVGYVLLKTHKEKMWVKRKSCNKRAAVFDFISSELQTATLEGVTVTWRLKLSWQTYLVFE